MSEGVSETEKKSYLMNERVSSLTPLSPKVVILDGTNVSKARRNLIIERMNKEVRV